MRECEELLKIVQRNRNSWLDLAVCKPPECCTHAKHARSWRVALAVALQDKSPRLARLFARSLNSWLNPIARSSHQDTLFGKNWLFTFLSHPTIYRPLYPRNGESFQREFWERNSREKQDWLIHNLHIEILQIPLFSSSPLLNPWEAYDQNLYSPYPYLWEDCLVLWEAVKKEPISYW